MLNKDGTVNPERNIKEVKKSQQWMIKFLLVFFGLVAVSIAFGVTTSNINNNVTNSGSQVQDSINKSSPGTKNVNDGTGNVLLTDKESGTELTVRSEGDNYLATSGFDPITNQTFNCVPMSGAARATVDVQRGVVFKLGLEDSSFPGSGIASDVYSLSDGDFHVRI